MADDALHRAVACGDLQELRRRLESGDDPNAPTEDGGTRHVTPLHTAAKSGQVEVAAALLDAGARFSWDSAGWGPLHCAVEHHHAEMAALLLRRGAPLLDPNDYGDTPLHIAADNKDLACAGVLLEHAQRIDRSPQRAGLPLYDGANEQIVENARTLGTVRSLLDWQSLGDGATALHRSLEPGFDVATMRVMQVSPALVQLLVERGSDLELRSKRGERPIDTAIRRGRPDLVALLGG